MFCTKCGTNLEAGEAFCTNCGAKNESFEQSNPMEQAPQMDSYMNQPMQQAPQMQPMNQQMNQQMPYNPYVQQYAYNPFEAEKKKNNMILCVMGCIFAILALVAQAVIFFEFTKYDVYTKNVITSIIFMVLTVSYMVFMFTDNKIVSSIKGVLFLGFMGMHIFSNGFETLKQYFENFDLLEFGSEYYFYAISLIIFYIAMYLFLLTDGIRGLFNLRGGKGFTLFVGYAALISSVVAIIVYSVIMEKLYLVKDFVPINSQYPLLFLGAIFGIAGKRK